MNHQPLSQSPQATKSPRKLLPSTPAHCRRLLRCDGTRRRRVASPAFRARAPPRAPTTMLTAPPRSRRSSMSAPSGGRPRRRSSVEGAGPSSAGGTCAACVGTCGYGRGPGLLVACSGRPCRARRAWRATSLSWCPLCRHAGRPATTPESLLRRAMLAAPSTWLASCAPMASPTKTSFASACDGARRSCLPRAACPRCCSATRGPGPTRRARRRTGRASTRRTSARSTRSATCSSRCCSTAGARASGCPRCTCYGTPSSAPRCPPSSTTSRCICSTATTPRASRPSCSSQNAASSSTTF